MTKEIVRLTLVTRTVVAGPPGCSATEDSWESPESLKRLATILPKQGKVA